LGARFWEEYFSIREGKGERGYGNCTMRGIIVASLHLT
jgi:hypothetical protein